MAQISDSYFHIDVCNGKRNRNVFFCTTLFCVGFQAPSACHSNISSAEMKMNVEMGEPVSLPK